MRKEKYQNKIDKQTYDLLNKKRTEPLPEKLIDNSSALSTLQKLKQGKFDATDEQLSVVEFNEREAQEKKEMKLKQELKKERLREENKL